MAPFCEVFAQGPESVLFEVWRPCDEHQIPFGVVLKEACKTTWKRSGFEIMAVPSNAI